MMNGSPSFPGFATEAVPKKAYRTACSGAKQNCSSTTASRTRSTTRLAFKFGHFALQLKQSPEVLPRILFPLWDKMISQQSNTNEVYLSLCFQVDTHCSASMATPKWSTSHVVASLSQIPCKRWDLKLVHTTLSLPFRPCYLGCKVRANALTESQCSLTLVRKLGGGTKFGTVLGTNV